MPLGLGLSEVSTTNRAMQHEVRNNFGEGPSIERTSRLDHLKTCPNEGTNVHLNNMPRETNSQKETPKKSVKDAPTAGGHRLADCIDVGLISAAAKLPVTRRSGEATEAPSVAKLPAHFVKNACSQGFVVATDAYPSSERSSILKASEGDLLEIWHEENGWCYGTHVTTRKTVEGCWKKEWARSVQIESNGNDHRGGNDKMLRKLWQRRIQQAKEAHEKDCDTSCQVDKGAKSVEDELIREEEAAALRASKKKSKKKGKSRASKGEPQENASIVGSEDVQEEENEAEEEAAPTVEEPIVAQEPEQQQEEVPAVTEADQEDGWENCRNKKSKKKARKEKVTEEHSGVINHPEEESGKKQEEIPKEATKEATLDEKTEDEQQQTTVEVREEETATKSETSEESTPVAKTVDASPSLSAKEAVRWADLSDDDDDEYSFLDEYHKKMAESETPETETPSEPIEEMSQDDNVKELSSPKESPRSDETPRSDEVESEESGEWQDVSRKKKVSSGQAGKTSKGQWEEWDQSKMKREWSKEEWEEWDRSKTGSGEWKEAQSSKSKKANQKGGHPRKDVKSNSKWLCTFHIGIENDADFGVARRILGSRGANMKSIGEATGSRLRLRGQGSNYAEPDTGVEAAVPLQLKLSCTSLESYNAGKTKILELLDGIYEAFEKHRGGTRLEPNLEEHPRNSMTA